ncbi:MAG: biopolymer transporter ExbD [Verrucomicrobiia bacterium]
MPQIHSPRQGRKPRLEIIPFIDIMFFLLATFMMVSLSMIHNAGIDLNLPRASTAVPQDLHHDTLTISVSADGQLFRDRQPATLEELRDEFNRLAAGPGDPPRILLQGDRQAQFGLVVDVFDAARASGLTRLILRTEKP